MKPQDATVTMEVERGSYRGYTLGQRWTLRINNAKSLSDAERRARSLHTHRSTRKGDTSSSSRVIAARWASDDDVITQGD